jgi:PAS domain S-box-containing protein
MDSHVVVSGEVSGSVRIVEGSGEAWLGLKGEDGSFFVKAYDPQLVQACRSLQPGDIVTVVGQLHSFIHKRCGKHHVWIKALSLARGTPPPAVPPVAPGPKVMDTAHAVAEGGLVEWMIREYTERYRHASQATSTYAYTLYPANGGCAVEWAGALAPIASYRPDEVAGDWTPMVAPEDIAAVREHVQAVFSRADVIEFRVIAKDGDVRWVRDHGSPVHEAGAIARVYGAMQDITELKRLEARLLRLQEMVLVGKLIGGIAYDFNNLLTVIGCHAEMLLQVVGGESTAPGADAGKILDACRRAAWLTKQLLTLGQRQMIQPELLDLNALVAEVGELVRRVTRGIELELALDPALGYIRADQGQAEHLVANLIIHACDGMPGGGRLTISTERGALAEEAPDRPGQFAVLTVSSAGMREIPAQAGGRDEEADTSLGIVYETARQIGATVRAAGGSEGAAISVYLPQVEASGELPRLAQGLPPHSPDAILVVDSDDMVRGVVRRVLQQAGYRVLEARRGDEALDVIAHAPEPVALALVEAADNAEMVERMASAYPRVKVILMAGVEPGPDRSAAFLRKPFTHGELLRVVREALAAGGGYSCQATPMT